MKRVISRPQMLDHDYDEWFIVLLLVGVALLIPTLYMFASPLGLVLFAWTLPVLFMSLHAWAYVAQETIICLSANTKKFLNGQISMIDILWTTTLEESEKKYLSVAGNDVSTLPLLHSIIYYHKRSGAYQASSEIPLASLHAGLTPEKLPSLIIASRTHTQLREWLELQVNDEDVTQVLHKN